MLLEQGELLGKLLREALERLRGQHRSLRSGCPHWPICQLGSQLSQLRNRLAKAGLLLLELVRQLGRFFSLFRQQPAALGQMASPFLQLVGFGIELRSQPVQVRKQLLHELIEGRTFVTKGTRRVLQWLPCDAQA